VQVPSRVRIRRKAGAESTGFFVSIIRAKFTCAKDGKKKPCPHSGPAFRISKRSGGTREVPQGRAIPVFESMLWAVAIDNASFSF
ncbi:hypothetical protein, partial [Robiginitalea sp.]|uniref:hypothetical protein n=1 Tax=Robiginitalea sp. TaxID=1902411 RepID=UPI003C77EC89